jgi:CRISPR-associated protein Cst1
MDILRYTGHPLIDVGVATITTWMKRPSPEQVTEEDLKRVAAELKHYFCDVPAVINMSSVIFANAPFSQSAMTAEAKLLYADDIFGRFINGTPLDGDVRCAFFPEKPAVMLAHRQHLPLTNGSQIYNFSANASAGLPVSGEAILAIHAMPFGCRKCGNYLAIHQLCSVGQTPTFMQRIAGQFLRDNREFLTLSAAESSGAKWPAFGAKSNKNTRYVEALLSVQMEANKSSRIPHHVTGYYFTNYGPGPDVELVYLDSAIIDFVDEARLDQGDTWNTLVHAAWEHPKPKKGQENPDDMVARNGLYEDLFKLPQEARRFLYRRLRPTTIRSWSLIELFLRKVMQMEQERINTYRKLGDQLTKYMDEFEGDALGFYYKVSRSESYDKFRLVLRSAEERVAKSGAKTPLFTFDDFIFAFEHPSMGRSDWRLGRDLIAYRMLEQLFERKVDLSKIEVPATEEEEK